VNPLSRGYPRTCHSVYFCIYACISVGDTDSQQLRPRDNKEETRWVSSRRELADCLVEVLSDVLELEMKAVFEDLWLEVTLGTVNVTLSLDCILITAFKTLITHIRYS